MNITLLKTKSKLLNLTYLVAAIKNILRAINVHIFRKFSPKKEIWGLYDWIEDISEKIK